MMRLHDDRALFRPEGLTTRPHTDLIVFKRRFCLDVSW